ncbi:TIGR02594 family protein [Acinetobacter sp. MB5]|uniref:TIGR02594 family protein n=1 Tax=Acinetobacter sp. MB5 TaxID=2069438 RepID=UPI000DCFB4CA|nr:TIGR02594 family protein [Acinetobacter sp. MB5]
MTVAKDKLYDITFILHDLTHKPIANLYYEIKNQQDMVKKGMTNAQGEISLKYVGGNILTVFVRKAHDQKMKQIGEIHTPNKNIKVKMISPKMKFDVTLLPQGNQGKYWRGTYKVKKGDTLSKIAKEHHTTVSALLALNPSIKSPNQIYQNQAIELGESNDNAVLKLDEHSVIKVPPAKKTTGHVISDRKSTGGSSSSTTATPQAKQQTSTTQVEHKSASPQVQPSPTPSKAVTQKTQQPTAAKKTSTVATTTATPQKIAVQQEHNENKKPVAVASLSGCVCKQYDLIWGAKVNCEFRKKVVAIASELWGEEKKIKMANMLMAVFAWESGFTFRADAPNQSNSGGTGLIQIMPKTFRAITGEEPIIEKVTNYWGKPKKGKPDIELRRIKQLAKLTPAQYLDYVKKYFEPQKGKNLEFIDFYLLVLFPVSSGKPDHVVFADNISKIPQGEEESIRQKRVNAFPKNNMDGYIIDDKGNAVKKGVKDGKVMKSEIAIAVSHYLKDGENYKSNYLDGCSIKPKTTPLISGSIAPWMKIAIREAKQWKGKKEGEIQKVDNYHTMVKSGYKTMVGDKNPWCASFVNYCLKETNYKMSKALASSQSFKWDSSFVKISKPAYGAIAVWTSEEDKRYGHVCFVLGISGTANFIRLGGNQGDMITVDSRSITTYKYYLPKKYYEEIHGVINIASEENLKNLKEQGFPVYDSNATR